MFKIYLSLIYLVSCQILAQDADRAESPGVVDDLDLLLDSENGTLTANFTEEQPEITLDVEENPNAIGLDDFEIQLMNKKIDLLMERLEHLYTLKDKADVEGARCSPQTKSNLELYDKQQKKFEKKNKETDRNFNKNIVRGTLNSLKYKHLPFFERQYVYPNEADTSIVHYDFMHIRMKKQSTRFVKVPATSNSQPKYVVVTIDSKNILNVYDTTRSSQQPGENGKVLFRYNLTYEGVCNSPDEILGIYTAKTPANSYKKDNQDLKPDDRPWIGIALKNGKFHHMMLWVIDRDVGLNAYRRKHMNETRYLYKNQTPNYVFLDETSPKERWQYKQPEIRVEQEWSPNLIQILEKNLTDSWTHDESYGFLQTEQVTVRNKKLFAAVDTQGFINYFSSRNLRSFTFQGRYPIGAVDERVGLTNESLTYYRDLVVYGPAGFFVTYNSHFVYSKHMMPNQDEQMFCLPGLSMTQSAAGDQGIHTVHADTTIAGLIYALPKSGDQLLLFMIDIKNSAGNQRLRQQAGAPNKGPKKSSKKLKEGYQSSSDCNLVGKINLNQFKNDAIVNIYSIRQQLILTTKSGKMYSMETSSVDQILLYPYIEEIKPSMTANHTSPGSEKMLFKMVKKSVAEQNNEKGSYLQVLIPFSPQLILNYDYFPVQSRSKINKEISELRQESSVSVQSIVKHVNDWASSAGQFDMFEEGSDAGKQKKSDPYWAVNYLLGFICVCLVIYLMKMMAPQSASGGSSKGWGSGRNKGGGGMFGSRGKSGGSSRGKGSFGGGFGGGRRR